ncbi:MAG: DUF167 domain-containing protein [Alphaproteobacteria bacterium]|nr:DUF167 domain-containing protein [Alphaproteobacteria bacterium]MBR5566493.1 DUF167 domain-containing protein [Alphaproteobacteria bacterium]
MTRINVRVIPRAKFNRVEIQPDGVVRVHTTTAPTDGKATADVIKMLAEHYGVPKTSIKLVRGQTARDKVFEF